MESIIASLDRGIVQYVASYIINNEFSVNYN